MNDKFRVAFFIHELISRTRAIIFITANLLFIMTNIRAFVFLKARSKGLIGKNVIMHTDQGSQYAALEYRRLLYIGGFRQSMSRKGKGS